MDNWHVMPRLTLNLGIRYDGLPRVYEKNNQVANFNPSRFSTLRMQQAPNAGTGNLIPTGPGFAQPAGISAPFYLNGIELAGVERGSPWHGQERLFHLAAASGLCL